MVEVEDGEDVEMNPVVDEEIKIDGTEVGVDETEDEEIIDIELHDC